MPQTVTLDHHNTRAAERLTPKEASKDCVKDQFVTCTLSNLLMYKLCGFIQDERAEILDVSENHVRLLLGRPWLSRVWNGGERRRPLEVRLDFSEPSGNLAKWQEAHAERAVVDVTIRPRCVSFRKRDFHRRAYSILRNLRLHFVAD